MKYQVTEYKDDFAQRWTIKKTPEGRLEAMLAAIDWVFGGQPKPFYADASAMIMYVKDNFRKGDGLETEILTEHQKTVLQRAVEEIQAGV